MAMQRTRLRAACLLVAVSFISELDAVALAQRPEYLPAEATPITMRMSMSSAKEYLQGKTVALIIRGETFRYKGPCKEAAEGVQLKCTRSMIQRVIEPLEQLGNTVEVFFTTVASRGTRTQRLEVQDGRSGASDWVSCPMDKLLLDALHANVSRVVRSRAFETAGQAETMMKVLGAFSSDCGGAEQVSAKFDHIIILRHDLYWNMPIDEIKVDFETINVLRYAACFNPRSEGVHDIFWMMPGRLFATFKSAIGHDHCFDRSTEGEHGHCCKTPINNALAKAGHNGAIGSLENDFTKFADLQCYV